MALATTSRRVLALSFVCDCMGRVSVKGRHKGSKGQGSLRVHSFAPFENSMQLRPDHRDNSLRLRHSREHEWGIQLAFDRSLFSRTEEVV